MSVNINVISQSSNKTLEYVNLDSETVIVNSSNNIVNLPYDTSYLIYIQPEIQKVDLTSFLSISNNIFSGFLGYIWIIIIGVIFYFLIRSVKNYVK